MVLDLTPTLNALIMLTVISPLVSYLSFRTGKTWIIDAYGSGSFGISLYVALTQLITVINEGPLSSTIFPEFSSSTIYVDTLSMYLATIFVFLGLVSAAFSRDYIEEERKAEFYPLLLALVTGMVGVTFAGDLFTLFVFWEMMAISSYVLVAFRYDYWEAVEASLKYLIMSAAGTATVLFAISLTYGTAGTLNFKELAAIMSNSGLGGNVWLYVSIAMFMTGFGVTAAMVPFHSWLPDAHPAAPSPISSMLSGVVIKVGAYAILRVLMVVFPPSIFSWQVALAVFAVMTMTLANLMALLQEDIKRLLAFSSIAHIGYILYGISIATQAGIAGGLFHILNHALMKGLLFLAAGTFIHVTKSRSLDELAGIMRKMPISASTFMIGTFSLAGMPFLNTFWSELIIIQAGIGRGGLYLGFSAIMVVNLLVAVGYYMRLIWAIALKPTTSVSEKAKEVGPAMMVPLIVLASLAILIGAYPSPIIEVASNVAAEISPS